MHFKKILALIISLMMVFGIIGCNNDTPSLTDSTTATTMTMPQKDVIPNNDNSDKKESTDMKETLQSKIKLRFNENGEFKVLILADLHLRASGLPEEMEESLEILVEREDPDLIIMTGDNIYDTSITDADTFEETMRQVVDYIEDKKIPWMHVYGNHDSQGSFSREEQQEVYESFDYCISKSGEEDLTGVGNYVIPLYGSSSDEVKFLFWGIDSGSTMSAEDKATLCPSKSTFGGYSGTGYDYIHEDQIDWYVTTSKKLEEYNGGEKIPGLMAFHIPLQETYTAWENRAALEFTGEKRDPICASAYNSGLFGAIRMRGDVKAIINGHDHINDFMVNYGGVKLCYASSFTTNSYNHEDMHGSRVFVIKESNPADIETYMSYVVERLDSSNVDPFDIGYNYDFEGPAPNFTLTGWPNKTDSNYYVSEIKAEIFSGKGVNGSNALGVTRTKYHDNNQGKNIEVKWDLPTPGTIGDNEYLMVWLDLSTNKLDFRKAAFGLIADNIDGAPYTTDNYDTPSPFYYKADGSDTWVTMQLGKDGCFGAGDNSSVSGFKGWFAFPIKNMPNSGGVAIKENTVITGVYFYMCLSAENMVGKYVYIDNVTLVKDYTAY